MIRSLGRAGLQCPVAQDFSPAHTGIAAGRSVSYVYPASARFLLGTDRRAPPIGAGELAWLDRPLRPIGTAAV